MAKRFHKAGSGSYEGMDARRAQEAEDFRMMPSGMGSVANMPQEVVYKAWPRGMEYARYALNDTIGGIDKQQNADGSKMRAHLQKGKY